MKAVCAHHIQQRHHLIESVLSNNVVKKRLFERCLVVENAVLPNLLVFVKKKLREKKRKGMANVHAYNSKCARKLSYNSKCARKLYLFLSRASSLSISLSFSRRCVLCLSLSLSLTHTYRCSLCLCFCLCLVWVYISRSLSTVSFSFSLSIYESWSY